MFLLILISPYERVQLEEPSRIFSEKDAGFLVAPMQDKTIQVTRLGSIADPGERCELTLSHSKLLALLEGPLTLQCFPIDDIEAALTANVDGQPLCALCVIRTVEGSADVVMMMNDISESRAIVDALHSMRQERQARGVPMTKFVDFQHDGNHSLQALLEPDGVSVVKWRKGSTAPMPSFPHSRLDFLRLHMNKSVMQKISSFGDRSIDLSCDQVKVAGTLLDDCNDAIPTTSSDADDCFRRRAAEGLVLLLTDKNVYFTRSSGVLVLRIDLRDVLSVRVIGHHDALITVKDDKWIMIRSKYCHEVAQRVRPASVSMLPRSEFKHDAASQTDICDLNPLFSPSEYHLQMLVRDLEEQLRERSAMINVQRARIDVLTDKSSKGPKNNPTAKSRDSQEVEVLRHYASLLEIECERLRQQHINEESVFSSDLADPRRALMEAKLRHQKLEAANHRLNTQLDEVSRCFHRSMEEATTKALSTAKAFIRGLEKRWMSEKRNVQISFSPLEPQTKRLREINAKLIEELRERDRLIEELMKTEDPSLSFPKHQTERLKKAEDLAAHIDELSSQIAGANAYLESLRETVAGEVVRREAEKEENSAAGKLVATLNSLTLQAGRVANLEVMLLQCTQKKAEGHNQHEKIRALEKENAALRAQLKRRPSQGKPMNGNNASSPKRDVKSARPRADLTTSEETKSRIVSLSPTRGDETISLYEELEAQRIAFETRLQGLEMLAFSGGRSTPPPSMGVVEPRLSAPSRSPSRQAAVIEAQNILLRSHSPRHRDSRGSRIS